MNWRIRITVLFLLPGLFSVVSAQSTASESSPKWTGYNIIAVGSFLPAQDYPWFIMDEFVLTYWKSERWGFGIENQVFPLFQFTASDAVKFRNRFFMGAVWKISKSVQLDLYGFYQQIAWYGTHLPVIPQIPPDGNPANGFIDTPAQFYWENLNPTTHDLGIQPNLQLEFRTGPLFVKNKNRFQVKFVDQTFDGDHFALDYINEIFASFLLRKPPATIIPNIFMYNQFNLGLFNGDLHAELKLVQWLNIGPSVLIKRKLQISLLYSYRYDKNLEGLPGGIGDKFVNNHGALLMVRKAF